MGNKEERIEEIDREIKKHCGPESNWDFIKSILFPDDPEKAHRRHKRLNDRRRKIEKEKDGDEGLFIVDMLPRHDWM